MSLSDVVFFGAASMLLLHEMDAVDKREWRLLFVLRKLPDKGAMRWFIVLHLPIFIGLLALVAAGASAAVQWIQGGVDAFLMIHAGLHERLVRRGDAAFANPFSRWFIWGAAILGAIHAFTLVA